MKPSTDLQRELLENLWWDLRVMYQRDIAMADNGVPFRQRVESFVRDYSGTMEENDSHAMARAEYDDDTYLREIFKKQAQQQLSRYREALEEIQVETYEVETEQRCAICGRNTQGRGGK
jgi:hypothetical protein